MTHNLRPTFYDGCTFTSGRYDCTFRRIPESGAWVIEVVDAQSGAPVFETVPVATKTEAFVLAQGWLDRLQDCGRLASVLEHRKVTFVAEPAVLREVEH